MDLIVCILMYLGYTVFNTQLQEARKINSVELEVKMNPFQKENEKAFLKQFIRTYGSEY